MQEYIEPQFRKAGREDSRNLKALSDDNYDNQESGIPRVFAESAHINATIARNVRSPLGRNGSVARTDRRGKTGV